MNPTATAIGTATTRSNPAFLPDTMAAANGRVAATGRKNKPCASLSSVGKIHCHT
jgi:hypothetical protein